MSDPARPVTELRVTANVMALEAGTYCAFIAPGSPAVDAATGFPAVRLSAAPATAPGRVAIAGFGDAGWLAGRDDAALIRITGGPAQLLVTVYGAADGAAAPRIQVLRVSDAPAAASPVATPPAAVPGPSAAMAHVFGRGDVGGPLGAWIGEPGSKRWVEGFALQPQAAPGQLEYQAVLGRDWLSPWVEAGAFCGSRGMSLPILGLHVRPVASAAFDAVVSATFVDGTAIGPVRAGPVEAPSLAALEAFHVTLEPKGAPAES